MVVELYWYVQYVNNPHDRPSVPLMMIERSLCRFMHVSAHWQRLIFIWKYFASVLCR